MYQTHILQILNEIDRSFVEESPNLQRIVSMLEAVGENRCNDERQCRVCPAPCMHKHGLNEYA